MPPKANCEPQKHIREFRLEKPSDAAVGTVLKAADVFKDVKAVDVIGTSKGRGTAGAMKRHNFQGLPASHGVKKHHRSPGSVGSHASNRGSGRPKRGKRMAGRYGAERITIRNLRIVKIDAGKPSRAGRRRRPRTQRRIGDDSADEQEEIARRRVPRCPSCAAPRAELLFGRSLALVPETEFGNEGSRLRLPRGRGRGPTIR